MSAHPYNETYKKQNKQLIPATFKKAIVSAIHIATNSVDVYFVENVQSVIRNIPVSSAVTLANVLVGDYCKVDIFDEKNARDMVVAYMFGRKF